MKTVENGLKLFEKGFKKMLKTVASNWNGLKWLKLDENGWKLLQTVENP